MCFLLCYIDNDKKLGRTWLHTQIAASAVRNCVYAKAVFVPSKKAFCRLQTASCG